DLHHIIYTSAATAGAAALTKSHHGQSTPNSTVSLPIWVQNAYAPGNPFIVRERFVTVMSVPLSVVEPVPTYAWTVQVVEPLLELVATEHVDVNSPWNICP